MPRIPKYRIRKDRNLAYVEMRGQRIPLPGVAKSPESLTEYGRLVNAYLRENAKKKASIPRQSAIGLTVAGLIHEWLDHCKVYYLGTSNTASNEYDNCRYAVRPLSALFGGLSASGFTTDDFREVRNAMISGAWTSAAAKRPTRPWARSRINSACNKIKRMFRWAIEHNRITAESAAPLLLLSPLEKGRSLAIEREPIGTVDLEHVAATLPHIQPIARAMVQLQQLTGIRSDNICSLRPMDVDQSDEVWIYCPASHKGTAKGLSLSVAIGPKGQEVLRPYLNRPADAFCFSPQEAPKRPRKASTRYTTDTYRKAVFYGISKANKQRRKDALAAGIEPVLIPHWHPHQLRHTLATEVRKKRNTESARVALGQKRLSTTEIYAERDLDLAKDIAREMG